MKGTSEFLVLALVASATLVFAEDRPPGDFYPGDKPIWPVPQQCPATDSEEHTVHLAHESDCTKFYVCLQGQKILLECPLADENGNKLHFNRILQVCDWPERAMCQDNAWTTWRPSVNPSPPTTSSPPTISSSPVTTPAPTISSSPETTPAPTISSSPVTTPAPTISSSPETTPAPTVSSSPETTPAPTISSSPETTPAPTISSSPETTPAPTTSSSPTTPPPTTTLSPSTNPSSAPTTVPPTTSSSIPSTTPKKVHPLCQGKQDGEKIPTNKYCYFYYQCNNGQLEFNDCKDGLQFYPERQTCDIPDGRCWVRSPACPATGVRYIPHECCNRAYACVNGTLDTMACRYGWYWDNNWKRCIPPIMATCRSAVC